MYDWLTISISSTLVERLQNKRMGRSVHRERIGSFCCLIALSLIAYFLSLIAAKKSR